jgi:hypothetical protein
VTPWKSTGRFAGRNSWFVPPQSRN